MRIHAFRTFVLAATTVVISGDATRTYASDKNQFGLLLGDTVTPSLQLRDGGKLKVGSGVAFQLNYARRLATFHKSTLFLEVPAVAIPLQEITASNGNVPANYDSFFVTPALRLELASSARVSPWFSVGGGYALFDESVKKMDGSHNTTRGTSGGAVQFGGGVDIRTPIKVWFPVGVRFELRDFYTSKPTYNVDTGGGLQHNLVFSGGFFLRF